MDPVAFRNWSVAVLHDPVLLKLCTTHVSVTEEWLPRRLETGHEIVAPSRIGVGAEEQPDSSPKRPFALSLLRTKTEKFENPEGVAKIGNRGLVMVGERK